MDDGEAMDTEERAVGQHQQSLKNTRVEGLTKSFRVAHVSAPFYGGDGKVEVGHGDETLACLFDDNVKVISATTGEVVFSLQKDDDATKEVLTCFTQSPVLAGDIVTSSQNGLLRHWRGAECLRAIKAHTMPILALCYDPTGTLVASGSADRSVRVWDVARGYCTHALREHSDIVTLLRFHPNPLTMTLASAGQDNTVRLWDLVKSRCTATFREHMSQPTCVSWAPDEYLMVTAGRDQTMSFYELRGRLLLKTVAVMDEVEACVFLGAGHAEALLGTGAGEGKGAKAKAGKGAAKGPSKGGAGAGVHALLLGGQKGLVRLFRVDFVAGTALGCVPLGVFGVSSPGLIVGAAAGAGADGAGPSQAIGSMLYLPSLDQVVCVTRDAHFFHFSLTQPGRVDGARQYTGSHDEVLDIVCLPSVRTRGDAGSHNQGQGPRLAIATNSHIVRIVAQGGPAGPEDEGAGAGEGAYQLLYGHTDIVLALDASPDGRYLATSSKDHSVRIWDLCPAPSSSSVTSSSSGPVCVAVGAGHTEAVGTVALSPGRAGYSTRLAFAVSAAGDKILKKWTFLAKTKPGAAGVGAGGGAATLQATHSIRAHDKDINSVAVSPNDAIVASASQDKTIRLFRSDDLSPLATLSGHKRGVWKVVFSPVDRALLSSSADKTLRLWSMADYSCLRALEGHTASVLCCQFLSRGLQVASGSADGLVRLWDVRSGECVNTFDRHEDKIWALAVPPEEEADEEEDGGGEEDAEGEGEDEGGSRQAKRRGASSAREGAPLQRFYTGGSDARLLTWVDTTREDEEERLRAAEGVLQQEQQLANDMRNGRFGKALSAALALGHSQRVMRIVQCIVTQPPEPGGDPIPSPPTDGQGDSPSTQGGKLDRYTRPLSDPDVAKTCSYLREWNTNARHCLLAQLTLASLLRTVGAERLLLLREARECVDGLLAYSERHYQRIDRLNQASYVLDYMTSLMALLPLEASDGAAARGGSGLGVGPGAGAKVQKRKRPVKELVIFAADQEDDDDDDDDDDGPSGGGNGAVDEQEEEQEEEREEEQQEEGGRQERKEKGKEKKTKKAAKGAPTPTKSPKGQEGKGGSKKKGVKRLK